MDSSEFRPKDWNAYIGQERVRERLDLSIASAQNRQVRMDHVFLHGVPGSGKTSLAHVIAARQNLPFIGVTMPLGDTALKQLVMQNHGVVLLDELHRASKKQQEALLTLVEDGQFNTPSGFMIENHKLHIIGATSERGKIITPLLERFPIRPEFDPYTDDEMAAIAMGMLRTAKLANVYDIAFAKSLGLAAGGVPRNIKMMVIAVRDIISSKTNPKPTIKEVLYVCDVTEDGLSRLHCKYLIAMGRNAGEATGLKPLSQSLQASEDMVMQLEDLLVQRHYLRHTKRGRELTSDGWERAKELMDA